MLHHNVSGAARTAGRAHLAHATLIALHGLCCGLPILALAAASLSGAASGLALFSSSAGRVHGLIHTYEAWVLIASAALVIAGGTLELAARRGPALRVFPWLFLASAGCFLVNVAIILAHRAS